MPQSEDCLKLNIWAQDTSQKKKPVLLWIHGGRRSIFIPSLIDINRVNGSCNVLGFSLGSTNNPFYQGQYIGDKEGIIVVSMNYPGAPGSPWKIALLDQRMAIKWIRDNIAAFGSDPCRITLACHPAGGVTVDYYTYNYIEDPIVYAVVPMPGSAISFLPNTPEQSEKYYNLQLPPVFRPTIDEKLVFSNYEERAAKRMFAMIVSLTHALNITTISEKAWHLFNLAGFTCSNAREASYRSAMCVPTQLYIYISEWPNSILFPESGSYHGSDVAQLFGTSEDISNGTANTETEVKSSAYMMHAFMGFAADPRKGLSRFGWPIYRINGRGVQMNSIH
ncbi:hypothetical protein TRV_06749 [Trichophyton verrucosum HKI 0517]|uniref:Carboxylesterase type B domain-containing protein n=1 Tax=Trichophyton verrucosum (strain HKI 0517) TaxID=663202 RepID=D4DHU2_TRIVH|nr:uncharacterized protein TRV_06749 [Trichophyton verrucosum HKI 0517]EFE38555.1 hypothetical protein TRV_06749 [Trichophyton verrucosum HKI 0517]